MGTPSILPARSHSAISMPLTARSRLCAEPSVRVPERSFVRDSHPRIERVDLQRIFADQPRLERQDLLLDADAGSAVRLADAELAVVGNHLHQRVGAAAQQGHRLDVADPDALAIGGAEQRRRRSRCQETPSGHVLAHASYQ